MARKPTPLSPDEILAAEFAYLAQTAIQANEDRARVTSFYLVSVGSFIAGLITAQIETLQVPIVFMAFGVLFLLVFSAGVLTLKQLVRLRLAWRESALAMNQIKRYYAESAPEQGLERAFRWTDLNLPPGFARGSVSHLLAIQVSLLSAIMFSVALLFFQVGLGLPLRIGVPASVAGLVLVVAWLLHLYRVALQKSN